ncbi:AMP-binding protein [Demequina sp. TTPB684]|uniref:AMP-binding enzyme n=1 Tax=unclassified Demequina TaxID=2620311 RepID=UPI001CF441CE|nr:MULTISPECIES: AMP-binding protein [unclassified Demequina]MCB2411557.1 AMP-binding protein [Demequina sp. TTPB684]UPU88300.1 AMP-binding protein [Demequina sp. TMPB413]
MEYARLIDGAADAVADALAGNVRGIAVATSGSTGEPSEVLVSGEALRASAGATAAHLGAEGHWLLALPTDRIAGAMVVVRSRLAGGTLTGIGAGPFTAEAFVAAAERLPADGPRFTSLVPTQLSRVLNSDEASDALETFTAVLVGGAALGYEPPTNVVRTYGLTETAGGCVYNGEPIGDTRLRLGDDGRISIATASLADAYRPERPDAWVEDDEGRWLVTSDLGAWAPDGRLQVLGRVDDVITTGGFKVNPHTVERALDTQAWIKDSAVVGVPNPEWGAVVVAFVAPVALSDMRKLHEVRSALEPVLARHELPRELVVVEALPRLATGKVNYRALRSLAVSLDRKNP